MNFSLNIYQKNIPLYKSERQNNSMVNTNDYILTLFLIIKIMFMIPYLVYHLTS